MDELTKRVRDTESKVIEVLNDSQLPPIIIDMLLTGVLRDVKQAEAAVDDAQEVHDGN